MGTKVFPLKRKRGGTVGVHLLAGRHVVMPLASLVLLVLESNVQRT